MFPHTYKNLQPYFGDLHNHCAIGYGHGSVEDAFQNARLQLDFVCVTPHAHWPDIPSGEARLKSMVDFHLEGFERARQQWGYLQEVVEKNYSPGQFVSFLGCEWHSRRYGDHHLVFNGSQGEILRAPTLEQMREELRRLKANGLDAFLIPHHIGYKQGYRGIDWESFDPEFSPVVEIMSMHGASESDDAPYPYLHSMGPRDYRSTFQYGLAQGKIAGVVGSTDHHSAHPGSYGHGRAAVWASGLSREALWDALARRRTVALTGDRIALGFAINGEPMGSLLPPRLERTIEIGVEAGGAIDQVELLHNNRVIQRWGPVDVAGETDGALRCKVYLELGWWKKNENVDWEVDVQLQGGRLLSIEPRFRGHEVLAPQASEEANYAFSRWERVHENRVCFATRTWGNANTSTASTQGMSFEIEGEVGTRLCAELNGHRVEFSLGELLLGSRAGYVGGFMSPAYRFHRAALASEYTRKLTLEHTGAGQDREWYTVRVRQTNNQYAWSSPIWIGSSN